MNKKDFENLKAALQEVVEIERGERKPSRVFVVEKLTTPGKKFKVEEIGMDEKPKKTFMEIVQYIILALIFIGAIGAIIGIVS